MNHLKQDTVKVVANSVIFEYFLAKTPNERLTDQKNITLG